MQQRLTDGELHPQIVIEDHHRGFGEAPGQTVVVASVADVDRLGLSTYHLWHATRADLLRRLERYDEARLAYDQGIELAGNEAERTFLRKRRDSLPR